MARDLSGNIHRGEPINLTVDEHTVQVFAGETLATVLLAQGITTFNRTASGQPRGPYCNMGTCFECQVQLATDAASEFRWVRACTITAREGLIIKTGAVLLSHPNLPAQAASTRHDS